MLQTASAIFPNTIAAFEGMELELKPRVALVKRRAKKASASPVHLSASEPLQ
jgi:hypothetical protein